MIHLSTVPSHTRFHSGHWSSKSTFRQYSNLSAAFSLLLFADQYDQFICIVIDGDDGDDDDDDDMIIIIIITLVIIILIIVMIYSTFKNI
jgi:hypothetical protein